MKDLITLEGYNEITRLFKKLQEEKKHWVKEKQIAAEQGDRSENAEYQAAKENIRIIDKQLFKLDRIINTSQAVDISKRTNNDIILFGSNVKLLKNEKEEVCYQIVGTNELIYLQKIKEGCLCISNISPMGKELFRKEIGDTFELNDNEYKIISIF